MSGSARTEDASAKKPIGLCPFPDRGGRSKGRLPVLCLAYLVEPLYPFSIRRAKPSMCANAQTGKPSRHSLASSLHGPVGVRRVALRIHTLVSA
jgi:hypothetical protein